MPGHVDNRRIRPTGRPPHPQPDPTTSAARAGDQPARRWRLAVGTAALVGGGLAPAAIATTLPASPAACHVWSPASASLQAAVTSNSCLVVPPGSYLLQRPLIIPAGHLLTGLPGERAQTVLVASRDGYWPNTEGMLTDGPGGTPGAPIVIDHLTVDGNSHFDPADANTTEDGAAVGVSAPGMILTDVRIELARCIGLTTYNPDILGQVSVVVTDSMLDRNGAECPASAAPPGAAVYVLNLNQGTGRVFFQDDQIVNNDGSGLDIDRVPNGVLADSTVRNLISYQGLAGGSWVYDGWAAVSLGDASGWQLYGNLIEEPIIARTKANCTDPTVPAPFNVTGSSAVFVCARTGPADDNRIGPNRTLQGRFGVLLMHVGDNLAAGNQVIGNDTTGSLIGCADHQSPGTNRWTGNLCQGARPSGPRYF